MYDSMHHQDICNILRIVDDYFLLSSPHTSSTIKCKKMEFDRSNAIIIGRQLKHGFLSIEINGQDKDNDDVDIIYNKIESNKEFDKKVQISCNNFTFDRVRLAVRDIVVYDGNQGNVKSK